MLRNFALSALIVLGSLISLTGCPAATPDDCVWTVTNDIDDGEGTTYDIVFLNLRLSGETAWGDDLLGSEILAFGDTFAFDVIATDGDTWDLQAEDVDGDLYTKANENWCANGEALSTTFTLSDID